MGFYRICVGGAGDFPLRSRRVSQTRRKGPVTISGHGEKHAYGAFLQKRACKSRGSPSALEGCGKSVFVRLTYVGPTREQFLVVLRGPDPRSATGRNAK